MADSDLHLRSASYNDNYDISLEEEDDVNDDDYAADAEDNGDVPHKHRVFYDPGHFRYNRKVCVAAIPCLLLLFAVAGEMLLVIASFGVALLLSIDHGGQNQRTVVIFIVLFIPCHILILYSFIPLLWVSLLSMLLMVLINAFVLLTGAWLIIQFTIFRKQEAEMCAVTEKLLFSAYPGLSACLLTWAVATVIPLKFIPFVLTAVGFVFLQLFMTPANSSFKLQTKDTNAEEPAKEIIDHLMLAAIATVYCLLPTCIQIAIGVYQLSPMGVFQTWFMVDVIFLLSLSVFLTTLMSIRSVIESIGMDYNLIIKLRWVSGAIATTLCYPALLNLGISSHFLPWLPAAIALYSSFGALLSYKKYKVAATVCFALALIFSLVWPAKLPWKLSIFNFIFGLPLTSIYVFLLANSILCLTTAFVSTHGRQELFSILLTLQTFVFIKCEFVLFSANLYGWPLFIITMTAATYTIQRLHVSRRLPQGLSCFCMSAHITKGAAVLLYMFVPYQALSVFNCLTLFFLVFMVTRVFINEIKPDITVREIATNLTLLSMSVMANVNPLLFILGSYLFQESASVADATGIGFIISGLLVITVSSLHLSGNIVVRKLGIAAIVIGLFILMLQPGTELTGYSVLQWCEMVSVLLTVIVLGTDFVRSFDQIAICSVFLGVCPGVRAVIMLYPVKEDIPVVGATMFVVTTLFITCAIFCFFKARNLGHAFEKHMIKLCVLLVVLSQISLVFDLLAKDKRQGIFEVPAWKLFLGANLTISVSLKILSLQKYKELIPLRTEKDEKTTSLLPLAGNASTIMSFLLTCLLGPATGFLQDVWCCGASLILICLQKDMRLFYNLKEENQTAPTKLAAVMVLVISTLCRTRVWDAHGITILRCLVEISVVLAFLPVIYMLWGIMWKNEVLLSEQVVVFILPLVLPLALYGSSYTSWALAFTLSVSCLWMMANYLPLLPYLPPNRRRS